MAFSSGSEEGSEFAAADPEAVTDPGVDCFGGLSQNMTLLILPLVGWLSFAAISPPWPMGSHFIQSRPSR